MPKPTDANIDTQVKPDPVLEKRTRRGFTTQYKLNILSQADQCQRGEIGALLRREKLYASQLSDWRKERDRGDLDALAKTEPGPRAKLNPEQKRIVQLESKRRPSTVVHSENDRVDDCVHFIRVGGHLVTE